MSENPGVFFFKGKQYEILNEQIKISFSQDENIFFPPLK